MDRFSRIDVGRGSHRIDVHTGNGQEIVKLNETRKREAEGILIEGGCTTYNH